MANIKLLRIYQIFECCESGPISELALHTLQEWGLIPSEGEYLCGAGHVLKLIENADSGDGYSWRCCAFKKGKGKRRCNLKVSLRKNTFFDKSKLPIFKMVAFAYLWIKNTTLDFIMDELTIAKHTAVDWSSFCREVVFDGMIINKNKIGGDGVIVEIDESKFGRRKYHRGHRVEGQWVFGGVERGTNRCFMVPVEKRDKDTLLQIIKEWILPGSIVVSDFWKAYDCLQDEGYVHFKVNHSLNFKDPETGQHTNTIEGLWRHAKVFMPQFHRKKQFFCGYLAKFMFLRHCKATNIDPLTTFFKMAGNLYNPCNPRLVAEEDEDEDDYEVDMTA